jgi:hypothetical protein
MPTRTSAKVKKRRSKAARKASTLQKQKAAHDEVIRRYSGVGGPDAFKEE